MSSNWLSQLTSEHVRDLMPYQSARRLFSAEGADGDQLWLNANEAPDTEAVQIDYRLFNRYPDCQPSEVLAAYAQYAGVKKGEIITTRGADEGIELIIRAFCQAGKSNVLICPPTYGMYAISAETFNVGVKKAPLREDFSLDLESITAFVDDVNVVFICSPNNPTGTDVPTSDIIQVLEAYKDKAIVVVDEAYIEFSTQQSQVDLLSKYNNLVILRTLSKAFALAGIRCGFTLASPDIITTLLKVIAPYPVPAPVAQIATQALCPEGIAKTSDRVALLNAELANIAARLKKIDNVEIVGGTAGNFILFRHKQNKALMQYLVERNLYIRDQSKQYLLENCLRITAGTSEQNERLLNAILAFFEGEISNKQFTQNQTSRTQA
ncbi:histidinol-phosphate transaminase [Agaribacter marinus]|uniref:Histidinol-phosphate aminotransferase n=1 Tax=Agaribacter marinus TaxID=1431249 RepID=A0AA37T4N3_9ALTE|nr:histidinol-phosphate transaminase [Agaribacter marinus]GLR72008.1 histidinol-phosphate aminotransferase [Agaribacter marinus]